LEQTLSRYGLTKVRRGASKDRLALKEDEWFVPDLARKLGVHPNRIYAWVHNGKLAARQVDGYQGRWIVHADATMLASLKDAVNDVHPHVDEST
jgi:hypothetical protein